MSGAPGMTVRTWLGIARCNADRIVIEGLSNPGAAGTISPGSSWLTRPGRSAGWS